MSCDNIILNLVTNTIKRRNLRYHFMKSFFRFLKPILPLLLLWSCSTKVNKFPNRAFHSTTTKYNILFNGQESFKEGMFKLHESYIEDYDEVLPIYILPDQEQATELFPDMNRAIEKASKAIQRHSMFIKKKERNQFIDDAYYLMGRAHLYKQEYTKALEVFNYMSIAYKKEEMGNLGLIAMSQTQMEAKEMEQAFEILQKLEQRKDLSKKASYEFRKVLAQYYIREKNYPLAITELKLAIEQAPRKKEKARLTFIIAQLYQEMSNNTLAMAAFDEVLLLKPSMELRFQAKTKKALSSESGHSIAEAELELKKLLRNSPEGSQKSLIYLALAELELKKGQQSPALDHLSKASANATDNKTKKKIYLKFAQEYFKGKQFVLAQSYYDSCLQVITPKDLSYETIFSLRNNLTKLANNVKTIQHEDSLQKLASLDETTRRKKVEEVIAEEKRKKEEGVVSSTTASSTSSSSGNTAWYFANETTRSFGQKEFQKIWGNRNNEDNWRRKVKSMTFADPQSELVEAVDLQQSESGETSVESYLDKIPTTPEKLNASHTKKLNAHYDLGILYMEQLKEADLAIEQFKQVVEKYDTSQKALPSAYFLYQLCTQTSQSSCITKYKDFVLSKYPESEYAQVIKNPNYFIDKQKSAEQIYPIYAEAYRLYSQADYLGSYQKIDQAQQMYPNNLAAAKFDLLKAFCEGKLNGNDPFIQQLTYVQTHYKKTEESKEAERILSLLKKSPVEPKETSAPEQEYTLDPYAEHQYAIAFPMNMQGDLSEIKAMISDFNQSYFPQNTYQISDLILGNTHQLILVKSQKDMKEAISYHEIFNQQMSETLSRYSFVSWAISSPNLSVLYKNKDIEKYQGFHDINYISK